jgi:hypothetical protein
MQDNLDNLDNIILCNLCVYVDIYVTLLRAVSLSDRLQIIEGHKKIIIGIIKMCNNDLLMAMICTGRCVCVNAYTH